MEILVALGSLDGHYDGCSYETSESGRTELLKSWEECAGYRQ